VPIFLVWLTISSRPHEILATPNSFSLPFTGAFIGAVQGCIGAVVWKGKIYTVIDGETIPGILGVGHASFAGALGGYLVFALTETYVFVRHGFPLREMSPHGQARPLGAELEEMAEKNQ
jgi:hypothetical protein